MHIYIYTKDKDTSEYIKICNPKFRVLSMISVSTYFYYAFFKNGFLGFLVHIRSPFLENVPVVVDREKPGPA